MLATRFQRLDSLLTQTSRSWQFQPYHHLTCYFDEAAPSLGAALGALTPAEVMALDADNVALADFLTQWIPAAHELLALTTLPRLAGELLQPDERLARHTPARKWQQVVAFAGMLPRHSGPWLEWCAGKGHLGRLVSVERQAHVVSLERQAALCDEGRKLAEGDGATMTFVQGDAFSPQAAELISPAHHALALHACGDLHVQLLRHVAEQRASGVTLSPCCYHAIRGTHYQPLSHAAACSALHLAKCDLKLPLQETVSSGERGMRMRIQEVIWRLAFDCLQRSVRGIDKYLPVPTLKKRLLAGNFDAFCRWAAARKGVTLPAGLDCAPFLARGEARYAAVARMELVRHLFRRPLELWLTLDRTLFLQEQGYRVEVGEFCAKRTTPRNLLIRAVRS